MILRYIVIINNNIINKINYAINKNNFYNFNM